MDDFPLVLREPKVYLDEFGLCCQPIVQDFVEIGGEWYVVPSNAYQRGVLLPRELLRPHLEDQEAWLTTDYIWTTSRGGALSFPAEFLAALWFYNGVSPKAIGIRVSTSGPVAMCAKRGDVGKVAHQEAYRSCLHGPAPHPGHRTPGFAQTSREAPAPRVRELGC